MLISSHIDCLHADVYQALHFWTYRSSTPPQMQDALLVLKDAKITITVTSVKLQQRPHLRNVLKDSVVLREKLFRLFGQWFKVTVTNTFRASNSTFGSTWLLMLFCVAGNHLRTLFSEYWGYAWDIFTSTSCSGTVMKVFKLDVNDGAIGWQI